MRWPVLFAAVVAAVMLFVGQASQAMHPAPGGNPCANARPGAGRAAAARDGSARRADGDREEDAGVSLDVRYRDWDGASTRACATPVRTATVMYGTHPAVRIYYSPQIVRGCAPGARRARRRRGDHQGAVRRHRAGGGLCRPGRPDLRPTDWTIMIRRASASHDGWYWSEVYAGMFGTPARRSRWRSRSTRTPASGCTACAATPRRRKR